MHEHEITTSFAQSSSTDCSIRGGGGAKARTPFGSCPLVIDWFFESRFRNARIGVIGTSITLQCPTNGMRWSFGSAPFKRQTISSELESGRHRVPISVNNIQNIRKIPGDGWFFFQSFARQAAESIRLGIQHRHSIFSFDNSYSFCMHWLASTWDHHSICLAVHPSAFCMNL